MGTHGERYESSPELHKKKLMRKAAKRATRNSRHEFNSTNAPRLNNYSQSNFGGVTSSMISLNNFSHSIAENMRLRQESVKKYIPKCTGGGESILYEISKVDQENRGKTVLLGNLSKMHDIDTII